MLGEALSDLGCDVVVTLQSALTFFRGLTHQVAIGCRQFLHGACPRTGVKCVAEQHVAIEVEEPLDLAMGGAVAR